MRKLASIQKILKLEDIPNADQISKATVLGWEVVVKKNEFNVGDAHFLRLLQRRPRLKIVSAEKNHVGRGVLQF